MHTTAVCYIETFLNRSRGHVQLGEERSTNKSRASHLAPKVEEKGEREGEELGRNILGNSDGVVGTLL